MFPTTINTVLTQGISAVTGFKAVLSPHSQFSN